MSSLIDVDAFRKEHGMSGKSCVGCPSQEICHGAYEALPQYTIQDICEWIDEAPTVETNEPKKGEWILDALGYRICSKCGHRAMWDYTEEQCLTNFCPNCGANMKGDSK